MSEYSERELAGLLRTLPPPPAHWVEAAEQIPQIKRQINDVLPFLESTAPGRAVETAELENAIEAAGLVAEPQLVAELQRHLADA